MQLLFVVVGAVAIFWWFDIHSDLFCLSILGGRVLVVRGRAPARFVVDVRDLIARAGVVSASIRARPTEQGGRLVFSGDLDEGTQQRLRNVFGLIPAVQLRTAPAIARPTPGQRLGIAWVAWLFNRA